MAGIVVVVTTDSLSPCKNDTRLASLMVSVGLLLEQGG